MTAAAKASLIKPGDCLLYRGRPYDPFDWAINMKTWHDIVHCEMAIGPSTGRFEGYSVASRNGEGVAVYPWRDTELAYVLRPQANLKWPEFWAWFRTVNGQGYDWFGLLRFAWFKQVGDGNHGKQFCSEFLCRAYRVLAPSIIGIVDDADAYVPADFIKLGGLTPIATPLSLK